MTGDGFGSFLDDTPRLRLRRATRGSALHSLSGWATTARARARAAVSPKA